jgi:hypothetical protein
LPGYSGSSTSKNMLLNFEDKITNIIDENQNLLKLKEKQD